MGFVPLANHDDVLAGDTLTTVTLNREWRVFIAEVIDTYFDNATRDLDVSDRFDVLDQASAFFVDLYD